MLEEIAIAKEVLGITKEVPASDIADWSFARTALKGLK
jgi:hypothetical protein